MKDQLTGKVSKFFNFIWLTLAAPFSDLDYVPTSAAICSLFFYASFAACTIFGANEAYNHDKCLIERVAELHPGYLAGCVLFGKSLPKFEVGGR